MALSNKWLTPLERSFSDIKQKLLNELHAHAERDRYLGNTSVGPHRHDVIFQINTSPALSTASRGEAREHL